MIDLKTLSEMPSVKEMMQRLKNPRRVSTTVTAVGSPLTDPEGVKKGHYSYSETGGIPDGMTQEEYDKAMKEFMEFSEMTPEQIEEMLDTMSKTTSPIKESNPMTRREELETKGISQLMAERFAKGVPTGAYSKPVPVRKKSDLKKEAAIAKLQDLIGKCSRSQGVDSRTAEIMLFGEPVDWEEPELYSSFYDDPSSDVKADTTETIQDSVGKNGVPFLGKDTPSPFGVTQQTSKEREEVLEKYPQLKGTR